MNLNFMNRDDFVAQGTYSCNIGKEVEFAVDKSVQQDKSKLICKADAKALNMVTPMAARPINPGISGSNVFIEIVYGNNTYQPSGIFAATNFDLYNESGQHVKAGTSYSMNGLTAVAFLNIHLPSYGRKFRVVYKGADGIPIHNDSYKTNRAWITIPSEGGSMLDQMTFPLQTQLYVTCRGVATRNKDVYVHVTGSMWSGRSAAVKTDSNGMAYFFVPTGDNFTPISFYDDSERWSHDMFPTDSFTSPSGFRHDIRDTTMGLPVVTAAVILATYTNGAMDVGLAFNETGYSNHLVYQFLAQDNSNGKFYQVFDEGSFVPAGSWRLEGLPMSGYRYVVFAYDQQGYQYGRAYADFQ